jgi:hypothetical protein
LRPKKVLALTGGGFWGWGFGGVFFVKIFGLPLALKTLTDKLFVVLDM